jgi:U32 family peptidase
MNQTNKSRSDIELLAPVGSYETLIAAIQGNANSVYFGIGKLNMRSKSTMNFSIKNLNEIVKICKENKVRSYVTLNSVMYDDDIIEMKKIVDACKKSGIDGIIASDISVLKYAHYTGIQSHISTQLNLTNVESVNFFSQFSDVVVLARELSLKQIKNICEEILKQKITGPSGNLIKVEIFVHGALCMAISGKCYLSLHEYNHSANRGECFQLCRRSYLVRDKESGNSLEIDNEYIMSPKDLCTISFLDKIIESGAKILKIEGRARSAEYVKTVAKCYNDAINSYINGTFNNNQISIWMEQLSKVYNRGFWEGYYLGKSLGEWNDIHGSKSTKKKVYVGKCLNYFSNIKVAEFVIETGAVNIGDELLIIGPTSGVIETVAREIRVDLLSVQKANKGNKFSIQIDELVRRSDKLYKMIPNPDF